MRSWYWCIHVTVGFPDSSAGKESACNARDPGLIPGSGRPAGEGIGYPLQFSWASPVVQMVKSLPAMWETWVWSLGWEDPPGEGKGCPLHYSGLENSMDCAVHGVTKNRTRLSDSCHRVPEARGSKPFLTLKIRNNRKNWCTEDALHQKIGNNTYFSSSFT